MSRPLLRPSEPAGCLCKAPCLRQGSLMQGAWKSDSGPCSPVLCLGVQGSLQVNIPWPWQECSQILAPLRPQSSQLPNGYNHPHPSQLIKANRAESTLERKTQRPHYTNEEGCYWTQEQDQKQQKGGVSAQCCTLSPLRERSRNWAGRTAPTGRRGPSSAANRPLTPGLGFLTCTKGEHSPCLAPSKGLSAAVREQA